MTAATAHPRDRLAASIRDLGATSKPIYLYLATVDEATISELQSTLEMQQLALFPTLDTLKGEGLIERDGETFTVAA